MRSECWNCKKVKTIENFAKPYKNNLCKECDRIRHKIRYNTDLNYRKARRIQINNYNKKIDPKQQTQYHKKYFKTEQGKKNGNAASRRAYIKHRHKWIARARLRYAVKLGVVKKPEHCEKCPNPKVQAHHHNGYSKKYELDVQWLCSKHHSMVHHLPLQDNN